MIITGNSDLIRVCQFELEDYSKQSVKDKKKCHIISEKEWVGVSSFFYEVEGAKGIWEGEYAKKNGF